MARIRTLKPEFWSDEKLSECSLSARLLFIGLISFADDAGRMEFSPHRIRMQVFPCGSVKPRELTAMLGELTERSLIRIYQVDSKDYLGIPGFLKHQRINRPTPSKIPEYSGSAHGSGGEGSGSPPAGSGMEWKGKERISEKTFVERDTRALAVFEHWRTVWRHPQATFDAKRRKRIEARLKEFTVGQLQSAISGFLHSPWHCGTDPKGNGTVYDGIETLLRDASQVERGLALLSNPPHAPRAENASERILRKLNGTDERVIEHEPETQPLALPSR